METNYVDSETIYKIEELPTPEELLEMDKILNLDGYQSTPDLGWSDDRPRLGLIGFGVVNQAIYNNLRDCAKKRTVIYSKEKRYQDNQEDLLTCTIVVITVPTNHEQSIVETLSGITENLNFLIDNNFKGIVTIKSTCLPSEVSNLCDTEELNLLYWPEFLNARNATEEFKTKPNIVGGNIQVIEEFQFFMDRMLSFDFVIETSCTEMEAMEFKYYRNTLAMYQYLFNASLPELFDSDPRKLNELLGLLPLPSQEELIFSSDGQSGVGGACLPKDNLNLIRSLDIKNTDINGLLQNRSTDILKNMDKINRTFRKDLPESHI